MSFYMMIYIKLSICINHWVSKILITQIICVACTNLSTVLSKGLVPGTSVLQTLSPQLNFITSPLITLSSSTDMAYILIYVDDIIIISSSHDLRKLIMALLASEFAMKDLGPLGYFIGIVVTRHADGLFPSQSTYANNIITRAFMAS